MKLQKLNIDSYRHLRNISFDFTYPEGHVKAGKPLDKICIIGQSATGKTSILELVKNNVRQLSKVEVTNGKFFWHYFKLEFEGQLDYLFNGSILKVTANTISLNNQLFQNFTGNSLAGTVGNFIPDGIKLLYLSTEIISKEIVNIFNQNPLNILNELSSEKYVGFQKKYNRSNFIYEFTQDVNVEIWFSLLNKILEYRKRFTQMASELINKGAIGDINRLNKEYAKWAEENVNPLILFADTFNPILEKLNLEIDLVNTEYPIPVKSKNKEEVIPISDLSTGTKGLLLSMFPLYKLDTSESIVLVDEPERSLFPDMQIDLITHYKNLAPEAQIIVATHSPFIAASFEPEERFILYFNEEGQVAVRRGESPIGDDPNDILRNDFNVDYYNDFGKKAYKDYLELKRKVKEETEPQKKKELIVKLAGLGDKYNF